MAQNTHHKKGVPASIDAEALLEWYDHFARDLPWRVPPGMRALGIAPDPYRVWLSEIMLQQTTIVTVRGYFQKFIASWPNVAALAAAPLDDVLSAWAGLGYYARARNLHAAAQQVVSQFGGQFPKTSTELAQLPGIGPYTAAAIAAICHDESVAAVDGNVERVVARLSALQVPVRDAKLQVHAVVQAAVPARAGDFAQALMDLGSTICTPRSANCARCPLQPNCCAALLADPTIFPVKPAKPQRPVRFGHAFVISRPDGSVWLRRRPPKGLLAGMTEVPGSDWTSAQISPDYPLAGRWSNRPGVIHVFTHFRLELAIWHLPVSGHAGLGPGWWSPRHQWGGEALPSLYRKVLLAALDHVPTKNAAG